ncbi:MAG: hypothetical protein AAGF11_46295 [Myxococcota bacterium]
MADSDAKVARSLVEALGQTLPRTLITKVSTELFRVAPDDELPRWNEFVRAMKAALAQHALEKVGNRAAAAQALGVAPKTFTAALAGGAFDDTLFPFVRHRWGVCPTPVCIEWWSHWLLTTQMPRCANEETKIIVLEDLSALTCLPSDEVLTKLKPEVKRINAFVSRYALAFVVLLPTMEWAPWFDPIVDITTIPVEFVGVRDRTVELAIQLFHDKGVPLPEGLSS